VKPPDLSTRQNGIVKAPSSPVFSRRNANPTGTLTFAAAGSQPLYVAPGSVTVLWILFQLQQGTTVQLFKNGEALSASYQLNAGAIVRYAGLLLLGNETLSLSVSGACTVTFEIAWVKEHDERLITCDTSISNPSSASGTQNENVVQWGGATVAAALADAPAGTEVAPVVRDIFRKKTTVLTRTPLAGSATFTSPWFDSEQDGTTYVTVTSRADQAGTNVQIQECDDISGTTWSTGSIQRVLGSVAVAANSLVMTQGVVRLRYYQVVYVNGATPQATFELMMTASNYMMGSTISGSPAVATGALLAISVPMLVANGGGGVGADALVNTNDIPGTAGAFPMRNCMHVFNGTSWDRMRNNANGATGDAGAKVATFNGATITNFDAVGAYITLLLGAVTGTTPTLTMQLQYSPDSGTTWLNLGPASATLTASNQTAVLAIFPTNFSQTPGATPANLTTGANVSTFINAPLPRIWRIVYTIGGTTPSFTISSVQVNYIRG
jgi:hypothetical protein